MFEFELKHEVRLIGSDETGIVIGRAEYVNSEPQYLVRYKAANGCLVESWWTESAVEELIQAD